MYVSYFGIRVQDPRASYRFYHELFGLETVEAFDPASWSPSERACILLRDPRSGQRLELNYYPPGDAYAVPYRAGEELDHIGIAVDDLDRALAELARLGHTPERMAHYDGPVSEGKSLRMAYVRDPDGIQIELFQSREAPDRAYDPALY